MEQKVLFELAQKVKDLCIKAVSEGFEEAGISGLCREGAIEYATDSARSLDIDKILTTFLSAHPELLGPEKQNSK